MTLPEPPANLPVCVYKGCTATAVHEGLLCDPHGKSITLEDLMTASGTRKFIEQVAGHIKPEELQVRPGPLRPRWVTDRHLMHWCSQQRNPRLPTILTRRFCGKKGLPMSLRLNSTANLDELAGLSQPSQPRSARGETGTRARSRPSSTKTRRSRTPREGRPNKSGKKRVRSHRGKRSHKRTDTMEAERSNMAANLQRKRNMQLGPRKRSISQATPLSLVKTAYDDTASTPSPRPHSPQPGTQSTTASSSKSV